MSIRYSKYLPGLVFVTDVLLLNVAFQISQLFTAGTFRLSYTASVFIVIANSIWIAMSALSKSYQVKRPLVLRENVNAFILTLIYNLFIVFALIYFLNFRLLSSVFLFVGYNLFFCLVFAFRSGLFFFLDYIRKQGYNNRKIVLLGDESIGNRLLTSFSKHPEYGYDFVDFISEQDVASMTEQDVLAHLLSKIPNEIFVCYKKLDNEWLNKLIHFADINFIKIKVVSDLILDHNYAQLVTYHDVPVLHITSRAEVGLKVQLLKRGFDVVFSSLVMISGLPMFVLLYLITKSSSHGPAFYKQERVGRNGRPFYIYKFRSMHVNAETMGPQLSKDNDPRITKWGRIMRKTRIDELPQFWNVLKGDMSVVGPRPERQHYIEKIVERTPDYKKLLYLKPGITSIGQVQYGYAENVDQMCDRVKHDLQYLQNVTLNSDLNIIIKTVRVMVQGKGK